MNTHSMRNGAAYDTQPVSREGRYAAMPLAPLTFTLGIITD